ncbi:hypothetical protein [Enterococcus olivae]
MKLKQLCLLNKDSEQNQSLSSDQLSREYRSYYLQLIDSLVQDIDGASDPDSIVVSQKEWAKIQSKLALKETGRLAHFFAYRESAE